MYESKDFNLTYFNTFRTNTLCKHFVSVETSYLLDAKLRSFLLDKVTFKKDLFLLGQGSNLLFVGDYPYSILYFAYRHTRDGIRVLKNTKEYIYVEVDAAIYWDSLVKYALSRGWFGAENLSGIPGRVGAAVVQNIGAYGVEIQQFVRRVLVWDTVTNRIRWFLHSDCNFGYRGSVFKGNQRFKVLKVIFRFSKRFKPVLSHGNLRNLSADGLTAYGLRKLILRIRAQKLESFIKRPNVGSFFVNPLVDWETFNLLKKKYPNIVGHRNDGGYKISAGWLIDNLGFRGFRLGNAMVSSKHALILVNIGDARGYDVFRLATFVAKHVYEEYGLRLVPEPVIVYEGEILTSEEFWQFID